MKKFIGLIFCVLFTQIHSAEINTNCLLNENKEDLNQSITIENNILEQCSTFGIKLQNNLSQSEGQKITILNNHIKDTSAQPNGEQGVAILLINNGFVTIQNNLIEDTIGSGIVATGPRYPIPDRLWISGHSPSETKLKKSKMPPLLSQAHRTFLSKG